MKNQYVADINDFRKYGLIRNLVSDTSITCGVFWMLTDDDASTDGSMVRYLDQPSNNETLDSELFKKLRHLVHTFQDRTVARIRQEAILPRTQFFEDLIPDRASERSSTFCDGMSRLADCNLIFFDPDNGLEVKSKRKGSKGSNKFLYLDEVGTAFASGHSLLIYQHFPRIERKTYIENRVEQLKQATRCNTIYSFSTGYVCFFLVAQPLHASALNVGIEKLKSHWNTQFTVMQHARIERDSTQKNPLR